KIGGYVRADYYWNAGVIAAFPNVVDGYNRTDQDMDWRARGVLTADVRSQTAYGVLRSYISGGWNNTNLATGIQFDRAFIQFAGFTFGLAITSFFDGFSPY